MIPVPFVATMIINNNNNNNNKLVPTNRNNFPTRRRSMVLPVLFVFFLAGFGRSATTAAAASLDFDVVPPEMLPQWEARTGLPLSEAAAGLHHPITFANATHGFVLTGSTWTDSYTTALYIYEAATDTWTAPAASFSSSSSAYVFPGAPRSYGYGVASHDLCGTKTTTAYFGFGAGPNGIFYNDFWKLEMTTGQFTPLADFPGAGRKHPAMNYLELDDDDGHQIHVGLGDGAEGNYQDYWSYSIADNAWTQLPDFPGTPRHHPYYFSLGTASYVGLGHSDGSAPYIERDWCKFETRTQQWSAEPEFVSYPLGGVSRGEDEDDNDERLLPITTEGRVAGTQFTMMIDTSSNDGSMLASCETSSSSSRNRTKISRTSYGFILSGDGDDHGSMETGEFHMYDPTVSSSSSSSFSADTSSKHWRALPPHPGVSRFAT